MIRQINETYNASNGWAIARTSSVLVNFSVWLERSVKQAETPEKDVKVETQVVKSPPKTSTKKTTEKKDA